MASDPQLESVTVIVDAVNECEQGFREIFLNDVRELVQKFQPSDDQPSKRLKFLLTSTPHLTTSYSFRTDSHKLLPLEDSSALVQDVKLVINFRIEHIMHIFHLDEAAKNFLTDNLQSRADQSFLWVSIMLKMIEDSSLSSMEHFNQIIKSMPRGLEEIYRKLVADIPTEQHQSAKRMLQILVASSRHLSESEVNVAFAMNEKHTSTSSVKKDLETSIRVTAQRLLRPFVRVSGGKITLLHNSAKDFLLSTGSKETHGYSFTPAEASQVMATSCISYLLLEDFEEDFFNFEQSYQNSLADSPIPDLSKEATSDEEAQWDPFDTKNDEILKDETERQAGKCIEIREKFKLFDYAAMHWIEHFSACESIAPESLIKDALRLMDDSIYRRNWITYFSVEDDWASIISKDLDALTVAAFFNCPIILDRILKDTKHEQIQIDRALFWACRRGHSGTAAVLLAGHANPNAAVVGRESQLFTAAKWGHLQVAELLLANKSLDVNMRDSSGKTPVYIAAENGHVEIIKLFRTSPRCRLNDEDNSKWTPLFGAAYSNHKDVIDELLKDESVRNDINHLDSHSRSAISWAARQGSVDALKSLLKPKGMNQKTVEVNQVDDRGRTPLSWAAAEGRISTLQALLKIERVRMDNRDVDGRNVISLACGGGHKDCVSKLIASNCPGLNEVDQSGWDPLAWGLNTSGGNSLPVVQALLSTGEIDLEHRDNGGRTALGWAATYGYKREVLLLLKQGADRKKADDSGRTPLDWAKVMEHGEVVHLLENYPDVEEEEDLTALK